jgi:hypothetical protein
MRSHCGTTLGFDGGYYMTCSKNLGRLLQASCLGLIGMLAVVGCGGSETKTPTDAATTEGGSGGSTGAALNVSQPNVNLGSIDQGNSGTATVIITNTGTATSGALAITASTGITTSGCSGTLVAHANCSLVITATPTAVGGFNGTISVSANPGAVTPLQISVTATVAQGGVFDLAPPTIDLGNVLVGAPAAKQTVTVKALVALSDLAVNLNGADVTKDATSTCLATLAAGATCNIVVNFAAVSNGTRSNSVVVSAKGVTKTVPITAIAQNQAKLVISPNSPQTLVTSVGQPSSPLVFGVSNSGDLATGTLKVDITGANKADFTATPGAGCTLIAPFGACSISVVFNPSAVTTTAETAALTVTDTGTGASTVSVALSGTAVPPSALAITPAAADLGTVLVGATGAVSTFTVTNGGSSASGALTVTLSSTEFINANDTCTGSSLAPAGTCVISLQLKPNTAGPKSATLTVAGTLGSPAIKTITGTGLSSVSLSALPVSLDFGSVRVNSMGTAQTVTVKNNGGVATGALTFTKAGQFAMFPITANTCSAALAPAGTCTFTINFAPTGDPASLTATYTVTDGTNSVSVPVAGNSLGAANLTMTPHIVISCQDLSNPEVCFNNTVVGGQSNTATFTVNMGTLPVGAVDSGAINPTLVGTNKADFTIVNNGCTSPLLANASCTITVAFAPTVDGLAQATLSVTSANGGSATSSLSSTGLKILEIVADDAIGGASGLDFGQVPVNPTPATLERLDGSNVHTYTVMVRGPRGANASSTTLSVALTDTAPSNFSYPNGVVSNPCTGSTLDFTSTDAVGSWTYTGSPSFAYHCQFTVQFVPQSAQGPKSAAISASGTGGGSDTKTLTGTATGPLLFQPAVTNFPDLAVGNSTNDQASPDVTIISGADKIITLLNTSSSADVGPISITLGGANADQFYIVADSCSFKTLVHGSGLCTVTLAFVPTSVGAKTATVTATAGTETASATVNGGGTTAFPLQINASVTPAAVDFGTVVQTLKSDWVAITVTNPTGAPTTAQIGYELHSAPGASDFVLADGANHARGTCGQPGTLQLIGGASCTILVQFQAQNTDTIWTATNPASVTDSLFVDAGGSNTNSVDLTGKVSSQLTISPATHDFGNVGEGVTTAAFPLTVTNAGTTPISLVMPVVAPFGLDSVSTTCSPSVPLNGAATCILGVTFSGQVGNDVLATQNLTVSPATPTTSTATATAVLTGTTVKPARLVAVGLDNTVAAGSKVINLGGVRRGFVSGDVTLTFQNTGSVPTGSIDYQWAGAAINTPDSEFIILDETTTGCKGRTSLAANAVCTVTIHFAPTSTSALGAREPKTFTLSSNQGGTVNIFALTAMALDPVNSGWYATTTGTNAFFAFPGMTPSPTTAPTTQLFQFTNATPDPINVSAILAYESSDFAVNAVPVAQQGTTPCSGITGTTPQVLAAGSCTFSVTFQPTAYTATTVYRWATIGSGARALGVIGTVQSPANLTLTPSATGAFGQVVVGANSTQSFTVTNSGQTTSDTVSLVLGGADAALFALGGACTGALAPDANCVGTLILTPGAAVRPISGTLQLKNGSANVGSAIPLSATGVFDTTLAITPTTLAFSTPQAVGTTTTATVTITNATNARDSGPLTIAVDDKVNFAVVLGTASGTCGALINAPTPAGLAGGEQCTVVVTLQPASLDGTGALTTNLTVTGTPGGTKTLPVTATAASALTISPAGPQVSSTSLTATVSLAAGSGVKDTKPLVTGISGGNYYITQDQCVTTVLRAGESCQITVNFVATSATPTKTGTLTVNGGSAGASASLVINSQ